MKTESQQNELANGTPRAEGAEARTSYRGETPDGSGGSPARRGTLGSRLRRLSPIWARVLFVLTVLVVGGGPSGCATNPVTGRSEFNLLSIDQDIQMGNEAWVQILSESNLVKSGPDYDRVVRVMNRLVAVSDDPGYEWEVVLIKDDAMVNAFALPGGKMAVYTGILPVTRTDEGLAVVMGHEIGHVIARHGTSRVTKHIGADLLLQLLGSQTGENKAALAQAAIQYGVLMPNGRNAELDADHTGLIYMARAGYDPRESVDFWGRMAASGGEAPPEWLSTHPSHGSRIDQMEELMPEALKIYNGN